MNDIQSSPLPVSQRSAAFARLASRVLEALNNAVDIRRAEGQTLSSIAAKIGRDRSALTRALNGTSSNLTIRTISDILWATNFDPRDFEADPIESISPNWIDSSSNSDCETKIIPYPTIPVKMDSEYISNIYSASRFNKPEFSVIAR